MPVTDTILGCARDNDADAIRELVQQGCPPNFANKMGQTSLHIGGIWGSIDAVKALLELRADPNSQNQLRGSTPLHAASMGKGHADQRAECVKLMVQFKADPNKADFGGELPIDCASDEVLRLALGAPPLIVHKAVQLRQLKALTEAVEQVQKGVVDLNSQNPAGETGLNLAVSLGWPEGVVFLLGARANPSLPNAVRRAPIHTAVLRGNHQILGALLDARANVHAKDFDPDHDPRYSSSSFEETPYEHMTALHHAAQLGNVVAMRLLLKGGSDPNSADSKSVTPLSCCLSLRGNDSELEVGSGIQVVGLQKKPEWNGRLGAIIGPEVKSSDGSAPRWPVLLEGEASEGVLLKDENLQMLPDETLDLLLNARADVNLGNHINGETCTLLHGAARLGDSTLTARVLAAGARLDQQDKKLGFSALHLAARAKNHEVVQLLIEARADSGQRTAGGKTAAELAEVNGASAATLALLRGDANKEDEVAVVSSSSVGGGGSGKGGLEALTPEQRAQLFID